MLGISLHTNKHTSTQLTTNSLYNLHNSTWDLKAVPQNCVSNDGAETESVDKTAVRIATFSMPTGNIVFLLHS